MSSSNCFFLTCTQISQEASQVVWYSHLFKNFPDFVVVHTVKGFGIVNKAKVDVFLELSCFFNDPVDVGNLIAGCSAFSKFSLKIWKSKIQVLLKHGLETFEHYFASVWDECHCVLVWTFFGVAFLLAWNETDLFQPCGHYWFSILLAFERITFTASSFSIWNSSTGIPSPPLAVFVMMLLKAHLTSHSRMSGSRPVITLSWLSGSLRSSLYSSSVYSYHLLVSSAFQSIPFLSFIVAIFAWNVPLIYSAFLKRKKEFSWYL